MTVGSPSGARAKRLYALHTSMRCMQGTSVRLDRLTKSSLDRLQAETALRRGRRPSHAEVISELIEFALEREREYFREHAWRPFTPKEMAALKRRGVRTGVKTSSEDIDRVLYGGDRP